MIGVDAAFGPTRGRRLGCALVLLLACAPISVAAPAKAKRARAVSQTGPDVFGGFSLIRAGASDLKGWHVSGSYPSWRSLSLVGDISGHYGTFAGASLSQIELMAGGRRYWQWNRLRPFAEFLVGGVRHKASVATPDGSISSSGTDLGVSPGFGADYRVTRAWAARASFDLLLVNGAGWEADPRLSFGAVYRFGER